MAHVVLTRSRSNCYTAAEARQMILQDSDSDASDIMSEDEAASEECSRLSSVHSDTDSDDINDLGKCSLSDSLNDSLLSRFIL